MAVNDKDQWHWQQPGKVWKGVGIYHVTLVVPSREPLLGELITKPPAKSYRLA